MFTIPNVITLANLFFGCSAVVFASVFGDVVTAFWLICVAAVCDFADGFVARAIKSFSSIGKELDSLADVVSFGVAPAMILFVSYNSAESFLGLPDWVGWACFLVAGFSALRLARFNVEDDNVGDFHGLPTPAAALGVAATCAAWSVEREILLVVIVVVCVLLVCNLRLVSLKFHGWGWKVNEDRYGVLIYAAAFFIWPQLSIFEKVALAICAYISGSIGLQLFKRK